MFLLTLLYTQECAVASTIIMQMSSVERRLLDIWDLETRDSTLLHSGKHFSSFTIFFLI